MFRQIVVVSAVCTAIGTFGGNLKDVPPTELDALVVRESLARAEAQPSTAPMSRAPAGPLLENSIEHSCPQLRHRAREGMA